jgi:hypothetical protein
MTTTTTTPEEQPAEPKQPKPNCFGPAFGTTMFVRWPSAMDLILARLGLNQDRAAVVRCLVSFWSPKKGDPWNPIVWSSAETIAERLNKNVDWVQSTLREFITGQPQKKRKPQQRTTQPITYMSSGQ